MRGTQEIFKRGEFRGTGKQPRFKRKQDEN
jgi:hypothetical protein